LTQLRPKIAVLGPIPHDRITTHRGDVVELEYVDQNKRTERQTGFMSQIVPEDVEFALDADAFVCMPITDYQVSESTLAYIKQRSSATILLDAHGPTNTLTKGGARHHRLWVDRDSWLPHVDILKMNLEEAGCSWFPSPHSATGITTGAPLRMAELPAFANQGDDTWPGGTCTGRPTCSTSWRPAGRPRSPRSSPGSGSKPRNRSAGGRSRPAWPSRGSSTG